MMCHRVRDIAVDPSGYSVFGVKGNGKPWTLKSQFIVNALWHGRLQIDAKLGIKPNRPWVHRLKYRVFARIPDALRGIPSLSMALGPYGDIVPLGNEIYLQWYPEARRGWSTEIQPPDAWEETCEGIAKPDLLQDLGPAVREGLTRIVPKLADAELLRADAGIIFAWGDSDIDRAESEFHQRHQTGLQTFSGELSGYVSIDTGKFTCAPLYAEDLRRFVAGQSPDRIFQTVQCQIK